MLREKIVTIIIGLVVGAMLAGAYFFGPTLVTQTKQDTKRTPTPKAQASKTPTPSPKKTLTITSPEDNSSTTNVDLKVSGSGTPNAKIIVFTNADQKQVTASATGKYETTIKLEEGENEVTVTDLTSPIQTLTRNVTLEITE